MEGKTTILDTCVNLAIKELCSLLDQLEEGMTNLREFPWWEHSEETVIEAYRLYNEIEGGILWDLARLYMEFDFDGEDKDFNKGDFLREFKELKPVAEQAIRKLRGRE